MKKSSQNSITVVTLLMIVQLRVFSSVTDFCSQPLGMERKIIADSQITRSSVFNANTHEGYQARLNNNQCWCSATSQQSNQWVRVDLKHPMSITGIATQGDPNWPTNFVTKFKLQYSVDGINYRYKIDNLSNVKVLDGATAQNQRKDNYFLSKPFAARYVEFRPTARDAGGHDICARFELYGCSYVCDKGFGIESGSTLPTGLTITASHSQSHRLPSHARLNNGASSWCSTSPAANYHLQFDFGRVVTITGIATQGSPITNDWVKEFYLDYGNAIDSLTNYQEDGTIKVLVGNKDKNTIVVNWFRVRLAARYVRVKPKAWNNWICMRVEIIGCDSEFIGELGAENRALEDSRFSAYAFTGSWLTGRYEAKDGRLNNDRPWGRAKTDTNFMWFKVDLGRVMLVNGIATQGDSTYGPNYFPDYKLQYSFDANGAIVVHVKQESSSAVKVFAGNTNNAGVKFNFLKGSQISTRYVQFIKNSNLLNDYTLRVEIYGRPQVCANSFGMVAGEVDTYKPTITVSSGTSADAKINSAVAWCASTLSVNEYFQYDFGIEKTISGIAIQGNPNASEWVKSFKVKYGTQPSSLTTYKEGPSEKTFVGSTSRDLIVYNWFATNLKTRYLRIVPMTWETGICLRVNVYGCPSSGCFDELGIASSVKVPDSDLTSSTAISGNEAKNGRFNADGTWEASGGSKPWIQVCFSSIQKISSVIIQGPGSKDNIAKVTRFSLKYLYSTSGTGYDYRHGGALKIFAGVKGRYESIQVDLPVAVVAKCLRLQVETKSSNINPGLRWELLGCSTVLRVSSVSVSPTTATTARGGKSTVTCTASGQLGMTIEWKKSTVVIQSSGSYVVGTTTISNSDVNGQSKKTLEITANGRFIATTFSTCVVTDASQGLVKCEQDYTCSASYDSISSSISTHTATFEVTGLQAKAAAPTGISASGITQTGVTISWDAAVATDFQVQDYRIAIKRKGTSSVITSQDGITGTTKTFSGLDVFTEYTVVISARCRRVHVYSDAGTFDVRTEEGASSAPATPTAVSETSRSIKVTWNEPSPLNGILHRYQIQYKKSDASFWSPITVDKHTREKVINGLDPYTSYEFQVSATTKGGTIQGAWSSSAKERTKEDYPSEPLGLQENNTEARYSVVKWSKPSSENGILRNYTLNFIGRKSYNSTFMHDNVTSLSASAFQYKMTNLVPGTNYTVTVAASTGAGRGNYSQPVVILTLYADPPKPSMTSAAKGGDNTEVTLKSASDINGPISKYELTVVNGHTQCPSQPSGTPVIVPRVPLTLTIEAGIKEVKGVSLNIETVGNFTLCYRAVITSKSISYYSEFTPTHLERKTLEKVNSTLYDSESGATQLVIPLVQGPSGSKFYQVVVYENTTSSTNRKDPKLYTLNELGPYNAATYKPGTPYITAEISSASFVSKFSIGDGKDYSRSSRKRRNTGGVKYTNVPLKPNTQYYVFQRAFISDAEFYSSAWSAPLKTKSKTTNGDGGGGGGGIDGGLIAGIVVPIILLIILIPLVILLLRRRKAAPNSKSGDTESKKNLNVMNLKELEMGSKNEVFEGDEDETLNEKVASSPPQEKPVSIIHRRRSSAAALMHKKPPQSVGHDHRHPAVSIKDFAKHSKQMQKDSHHAITEEYKDLIQGQQYSWSYASRPENKKKNRYANISAYDHSRVKLEEIPGVPFSDYFNANYVNGYTRPSVYIASQGPVDTGLEDFWRMIWDNNVPAIVMVTNVVERGKKKCAQYWPENGTADFGTISVTLMSVDYYVDYAIRAFSVQREGNAEVKYVEQYHFLSWPDMGIPEFPTDLLNLRRKLRRKFPYATKAPILVHCSAGVGRTGTFIVIDAMLELIATQKKVDVFNFVNYIRSQRVHLIQVEEQYIFIYLALLEEATCGNTEIEIQNLRIKINQLQTKDKNEKTGFDQQFQRLALVTPRFTATETSAGLNGSNIEKNRRHDLLPRDLNRVILEQSIYENDGNSDYINATFVNGYKKKNAYIATQHPLHETITDFWNMIYQREVTTIVLLNRLKDGPQTFPVFWPDHESDAKYGHITVSNHYEDKADHFVERSFYVNHRDRSDEYREIEMFHFQHWPDHGVPKDFNKLLSLISKVEKSQQQQNESQPIVIVCSDGAGRSGTFISIAIILERFKTEQLIDVFQTIKKIRAFQPEFVENTVQYKFCHNITQAFIESFDTYANFTG